MSLSLDALDADASRRVPPRARRLAEHRGGARNPRAERAALHRADHGRAPQRRPSSRRSPTSPTNGSAPRSGTSTSWSRPDAASSCPTSPPRAVRRGACRALRIQRKYDGRMLVNAKCAPHYIKTVLEHAAATTLTAPTVHRQHRLAASTGIRRSPVGRGFVDQDLFRGRRRVPGGHALHGDPTERRRHALPVPPGLRRLAAQREPRGPLELVGAVHAHSPPRVARRTLRRLRDERPVRRLPRPRLRDDGRSMAEDPLCTHTPGTFAGSPALANGSPAASSGPFASRTFASRTLEYGPEPPPSIEWDVDAAERMKKIPAFVRGMVVRAVEESCRRHGIDRVTAEELERIRARMPTPKMFG